MNTRLLPNGIIQKLHPVVLNPCFIVCVYLKTSISLFCLSTYKSFFFFDLFSVCFRVSYIFVLCIDWFAREGKRHAFRRAWKIRPRWAPASAGWTLWPRRHRCSRRSCRYCSSRPCRRRPFSPGRTRQTPWRRRRRWWGLRRSVAWSRSLHQLQKLSLAPNPKFIWCYQTKSHFLYEKYILFEIKWKY